MEKFRNGHFSMKWYNFFKWLLVFCWVVGLFTFWNSLHAQLAQINGGLLELMGLMFERAPVTSLLAFLMPIANLSLLILLT